MNVECCICLERESRQPCGAWPCGHVMHLPCIYRVFGKEYDEENPEQARRTGQASNNVVKCPLCNQKTRLRNIVRLYLQAEGDLDEIEEDEVEGIDPDDVIVVEGESNVDTATCSKRIQVTLKNNKARIDELVTMLTSARRRHQVEVKERMRLEQVSGDLSARLDRSEQESKRRLDAMRVERDGALRERKLYEKKAANLQIEVEKIKKELEEERAYSSRQAVALDDSLTGDRLRRKLHDCGNTKDWFHDTLETRNRKIMSLTNDMEGLQKEMVRLKKTVETLERENRLLTTKGGVADGGGAQVLSQIQNVLVPERRYHDARGAHQDGYREFHQRNETDGDPDRAGDTEKQKSPNEDVFVLLDDEDDVVGDFVASATAAPGSTRWKPASASFAMAGPSRETLNTAPGPSFIKSKASASTGLDNPGTYIKRYPDGRGGWTQNGRKMSSSGGAQKVQRTSADISKFFTRR